MSNYISISLLPTLSKIFEKLMYSRLINFFSKHNILYGSMVERKKERKKTIYFAKAKENIHHSTRK